MAISTLTSTFNLATAINAQATAGGTNLASLNRPDQWSKRVSLTSTTSVTSSGGVNEAYHTIVQIAASTATTVDLQQLTNVLTTGTTFARIKAVQIQLLSTTDDSTYGTTAEYVTVGAITQGWRSNTTSGAGWFASTASSFDIPNGGVLYFGVQNATGIPVAANNNVLKIANGSSGVTAAVEIALVGSVT